MQVLRHIEPALWWDVAQHCPYATFFHTPLWNEIARWYHPQLRDCSVGFVTEGGTRAIFPLLETKRIGPFQRLISSFEGTYGGLIADGPLDPAEVQAIYNHLESGLKLSLHYLSNPLAPSYPSEEPLAYDQEIAHLIHLAPDFEATFQGFKKSTRTAYRRGLREGARVRRAHSLADYQRYYAAYLDAIRRWGHAPDYGYRWELFEYFYRLERQHPDQIALWVVELDNVVVGGTLAFYWNRHATAWHGAVYEHAMKRKAMVVLDTEIARAAAARGYRYYDLNTSGKIPSLISYKRSFGAVDYPIAMCKGESLMVRPAVRIYRSLRPRQAQIDPDSDREDEPGARPLSRRSTLPEG